MVAHHVPGHMASAKTPEQVFEARGEIRKAPDTGAVNASLQIGREGRTVRQYELDLLFKDVATPWAGQP